MKGALPPGTLALAVARSQNAKLGDAATTYAAQASCPTDCVFRDGGGCYAETGQVGKFVTAPLNAAAGRADAFAVAMAEAEAIDSLTVDSGRPLRLHTVGDCPNDVCARIVSEACERYMDRGGGPVWTYTHAWRRVDRASWGRVSVLASCEIPADVVLARARGYATALVVEEFHTAKLFESDGVRVVPCPAQTHGIGCTDCGLCFRDDRRRDANVTIGFELHGIPLTVRRAKLALRDPGDPDRRIAAEERLRDLLAQRPGLSAREAAAELVMNEGYAGQLLAYLRGEAKHPSVLRRERYDRQSVFA